MCSPGLARFTCAAVCSFAAPTLHGWDARRLGAQRGECLGALVWFKAERHASALAGSVVDQILATMPDLDGVCQPPWAELAVGAPKRDRRKIPESLAAAKAAARADPNSKANLMARCKAAGLPQRGTKEEMLQRLAMHEAAPAALEAAADAAEGGQSAASASGVRAPAPADPVFHAGAAVLIVIILLFS